MAILIFVFQKFRAAGFTRSARQRHRHTLDMNLIKGEKKMKDFARVSVGIQAVKLNWVVARVRQFCYFLAQKGNPEIKA